MSVISGFNNGQPPPTLPGKKSQSQNIISFPKIVSSNTPANTNSNQQLG
jgi:hypothetical protein